MFHDELKTVSLAAMETAIGEALSKLAGIRYTCDISQLDLTGRHAKLTIGPGAAELLRPCGEL